MATLVSNLQSVSAFKDHPVEDLARDPLAAFYSLHPELRGLYPASQPDIQWHPNLEKYLKRTETRLKTDVLEDTLPDLWPQKINGPEVWKGGELQESDLIVPLAGVNVTDLEDATAAFKATELRWTPGLISRETFPLASRTAKLLTSCRDRLYHGNGLLILRGLDPDRYSYEDNVVLYAGLAAYIGNERGVQAQRTREVLGHVIDTGKSITKFPLASHTNELQPFHNDLGDILLLYALSPATEGGESFVASTAQVYNDIAATRPDLIRTLAEPWVFDTPECEPTHYVRPLMHYHDGHVTINFARRLFTGYGAWEDRSAYLPPISEAQAEALDAIEFTARKYTATMKLRKGDIQLQNNLATIHGRSGFSDADTKNGRHLLRLWVRDEEVGWSIPPALRSEWKNVFGTRPEKQVFPRGPTLSAVSDGKSSCS